MTTITGAAGTVWTNDTDAVVYQFLAALRGTCGRCLRHHTKIAPWWGIPMHPRCQCAQLPIVPGAAAPVAFASFRGIFAAMDVADRKEAIGASCYRLVEHGLVKLEDVVLPDRVRDLWEVVALAKLSEEQLVKIGIQAATAREALANAHRSGEEHEARQERKRVDEAAAAAFAQAAVVAAIRGGPAVPVVSAPGAHGIALAAAVHSWRPEKRRTIQMTTNN